MNPYEVLGLPRDCCDADVVRAYRRAAKRAHPDHGGSSEKFQEIKLARDVLVDPERRRKFDDTGTIDPSQADNAEAQLWNRVVGAMVQASSQLLQGGRDFVECDVVSEATRLLDAQKQELAANMKKADTAIKNWKRLSERIRRRGDDGKPNRLAASIASLSAQGVLEKERMARDIEEIKKAMKILDEYETPSTESAPRYSIPEWSGFRTIFNQGGT